MTRLAPWTAGLTLAVAIGTPMILACSPREPSGPSAGRPAAAQTCAAGILNPIVPNARLGRKANGRPWVVAYLAEGYQDPSTFSKRVDDFATVLDGDAYFSRYQGWFQHVDVPLQSCDEGVTNTTQARKTALMLQANGKYSRCYYDLTESFAKQVGLAAQEIPDLKSIVVVANRQYAEAEGCTFGDLVVIAESTEARTLRHEFGHVVAGLYDEVDGENIWLGSPIDGPNCTSYGTGASWPPREKGCGTYENLYRAQQACRMHKAIGEEDSLCTPCNTALQKARAAHLRAGSGHGGQVQLILRLYEKQGKWHAQVVGRHAFPEPPKLEVEQRSEFVVALRSGAKEFECVASPAQNGTRGRAYSSDGTDRDSVTDGLIAVLQCPAASFADVPEEFIEHENMEVGRLKQRTHERLSPRVFNRWWSSQDSPLLRQ
jgi:hypothetical protein